MYYKGITINTTHIQERMEQRTTLSSSKATEMVKRVCDVLLDKKRRGLLAGNVEWEIHTPTFKAVGRGTVWSTVLKLQEHNSRASMWKWSI